MTKECMGEGELKHRVEVRVGGGGTYDSSSFNFSPRNNLVHFPIFLRTYGNWLSNGAETFINSRIKSTYSE